MRIFNMTKKAKGGLVLGLVLLGGIFLLMQPDAAALTVAENLQLNNNSALNQTDQDNKQKDQGKDKSDKSSIGSGVKSAEDIDAVEAGGMSFKATAYCLKGRTASGSGVRRGIVAADPRVLPLGSTITISAGQYSGVYTVADTGGAVKGKKLDIWVPSCSEAIRFGKRTVKVSVSKKANI